MTPTSTNAATTPRKPLRVGLWLTLLVLGALTVLLAWRGYSFYRLGLADQTFHPDYRTLNPAGFLGHGYGMAGTALILTNVLYLVRRRWTRLPAWMGSVKAWLSMHVFTGLVGSVLILFHSAFQLRTPIATVTSASLAIVVVTGLVGLYLHALIPKAGLKPLKERLTELEPLLPGLVEEVRAFVKKAPVTALPADASFLRLIVSIPRWVLEARRRRHGVQKAMRADKLYRVLVINEPKLARGLVAELGYLAASEVDTNAGSALMRSWRSLHRFLALLMLVTVVVHIGVAWYYGFRWIFSK
ncbi:MAG TPA: hypothetical protein VIF62_18210 [Labilithrix sp.]